MYQLLRGVLFLHSANIMHRDLKPSNILVKTNCDLKICDFGLARGFSVEEERELQKTVYVVTRWYRAPEVMLNASHYTRSLDIWSIGCIFAEMILKRVLFPGQHNIKQLDKIIEVLGFPDEKELGFISDEITLNYIKNLPKPPPSSLIAEISQKASPEAVDLLMKMLRFDPENRITVKEAIKHPYFKQFSQLDPPESENVFDWSWDAIEVDRSMLQRLIYYESCKFHPEDEAEKKEEEDKE
jgi:mitogen-activated protein kinase 1/3